MRDHSNSFCDPGTDDLHSVSGTNLFLPDTSGKNGKKFKIYKFRSMYLDAEERKKEELMKENRVKDGMMFKLEWDPRIIGCKNGRMEALRRESATGSVTGAWTNSHSFIMS